jgi:hypothetical protein
VLVEVGGDAIEPLAVRGLAPSEAVGLFHHLAEDVDGEGDRILLLLALAQIHRAAEQRGAGAEIDGEQWLRFAERERVDVHPGSLALGLDDLRRDRVLD